MSWDQLISREIQVKNKDIHERSEGMSKFFTLFPHLMKPVKTLIKILTTYGISTHGVVHDVEPVL